MKQYRRNLWVITTITFGSILFWLLFNENSFPSSPQVIPTHNTESRATFNFLRPLPTRTTSTKRSYDAEKPAKVGRSKRLKNIACKINGEYDVNCLKYQHNHETIVFVPFPFLKKYFDIYGRLVKSDDGKSDYFEWNHSYSKIFYPDSVYDPKAKFLWFENYNVEIRERVLCISAREGVPISSQWHSSGHFYPTQIAQFGLSHFSKNVNNGSGKQITLLSNNVTSKSLTIQTGSFTPSHLGHIEFSNNSVLTITKTLEDYAYIHMQFKLSSRSSVILIAENIYSQEQYKLIFTPTNESISTRHNRSVVYGLGLNDSWHELTRDILMDLYKAKLIPERKQDSFQLKHIQLAGRVYIRQLSLLNNADHLLAKAAGDWFVRNQNNHGGWQITVKRKLLNGALVLEQGWHSAMAQGQAISLLTRLFRSTANVAYLEAAKKAINVFNLTSSENGVRAMLFDKFVWYEEYPTVPSIYVLNGCIYSLFGLYDLAETCQDWICRRARTLFDEGLRSLEALLPLFDSGSGSFYDLRHVSMNTAPNLARWDYHSTHVNQLLYLNTIVHSDVFKSTAERWTSYMHGHHAAHN